MSYEHDTDEEDSDPSEGVRLADGSILLRLTSYFESTSEGHYEHVGTVWGGTREPPGPDHGVWQIDASPTGFEAQEIIQGFLQDAEYLGNFEDNQAYEVALKLVLNGRAATTSCRFIYSPGLFSEEK